MIGVKKNTIDKKNGTIMVKSRYRTLRAEVQNIIPDPAIKRIIMNKGSANSRIEINSGNTMKYPMRKKTIRIKKSNAPTTTTDNGTIILGKNTLAIKLCSETIEDVPSPIIRAKTNHGTYALRINSGYGIFFGDKPGRLLKTTERIAIIING